MKLDIASVDKLFNKPLLILFLLFFLSGIFTVFIWSGGASPTNSMLLPILWLIIFVVSFCLLITGLFTYFKDKPGKQKSYAKSMIIKGITGMILITLLYFIVSVMLGFLSYTPPECSPGVICPM
jgi:hypothetical protein